MARGRKPLAPSVHKAKGSYVKNPQRENKDAPELDGKAPPMPKWFSDDEKTMWRQLVADMKSMGILSSDQRQVMIAYCTAYAGWMMAKRQFDECGGIITDSRGEPKRHPAGTDMHKHRETMNKLIPEFGLTPASRGKLVSMNPKQDENPFGGLLAKLQSRN